MLGSGLLNYIHANAVADDALIHRIETAVDAANRDAEWRERAMGFMTLEHSHRAELSIARRMGIEEGMKQGMKQGVSEGEARFGRLVDALLEAERIEDLRRAADDQDFRDSLFADLGL